MQIPSLAPIEEHAPMLAALVAKTSFLPNPAVVKDVGGAVFPTVRASKGHKRMEHVKRDGKDIGMYDDNATPTMAMLWAHGIVGGNRTAWTFAHVWSVSDDIESYTHLANLILMPECFASLTDKRGPLTGFLRWHAKAIYGWKPAAESEPVKPVGYDEIEWRYLPAYENPWDFIRQRLAETNNERVRILRPLMQKSGRI